MNIFIYCSSVKTAVQHVGPVVEERVVDLVNSPLHSLAKLSVIDVAVPPQGDIARLSLVQILHYCVLIGRELLCHKEPARGNKSPK